MSVLDHALKSVLLIAAVVIGGGIATAAALRRRHLMWTWASLGLPLALLAGELNLLFAFTLGAGTVLACWLGAHWQRIDIHQGADVAEIARARLGVVDAIRRRIRRRAIDRGGWVNGESLILGRDERGLPVSVPIGEESGTHTLVVGATGSGKTVSETWIACRLIERGHGAIVIDPKGDRMLREELEAAAGRASAPFLEWTPEGPLAYNPYAHGTDTEIADKAIAGEEFTEPHYLRQAQRYLGHAIRTMRLAKTPVTPASLMEHLDPRQLEVNARALKEHEAAVVEGYLDSLGERQRRELSGVRDRLSILSESDASRWLEPTEQTRAVDLNEAIAERAVVYFRLDSDRRMLLSAMLAAAIVSDLVTLVAGMQGRPVPTLVLIDEFSAVAAEQVARLFGRARSAGVSLILGTQELADLRGAGEGLREQVLANVATLIAHRQNVPESAELIAQMAGSRPVWVTTEQTREGLIGAGSSGRGTRRRGYEFEIHPSRIKTLPVGCAAVLAQGSGQRPVIAQICHPQEARR